MSDFAGLHVAAFESRRADEMSRLIEKHGGMPHVAPSMREVPLEDHAKTVDFAHRLITGEVNIVLLLTGVGTRHLVEAVEQHVDRERFLAALADVTTIARGPKVVAALASYGLKPTHRVAEPNTWREILHVIDQHVPVETQQVAVQEYGISNPSLLAGLEARGAIVLPVKVYEWDLPEDVRALQENVEAAIAGEIDVALFTSARQVTHFLDVAEQLGKRDQLLEAMKQIVIASIGPTTSDQLRHYEISVDLTPDHAKMGQLVALAAAEGSKLRERKHMVRAAISSPTSTSEQDGETKPAWYNGPFMKACRGEPTDVTPVWLMRQAGRYMKEYRDIRAKTTFLELCKQPDLCAEVAITALNRLGVDAAIIFSDLLPILEPMGLDLEFAKGEGPVIHNPVRELQDVDRVLELTSVDSLDYVMQTCRVTRAEMPAHIPLLGFAGAPFTLASYAIEGGSSRSFMFTKTLMYRDPGAWDALMERLSRAISLYLNAQIAAGVQAVQIFDSWVGCLSPEDYRRYVLKHTKAVIDGLTPGATVIHFGTGNPALLPVMAEAGGQVMGVDWRVSLADAWQAIGYDRAVQGNMEPLTLLAGRDEIRRAAKSVLDQAAGRPGHIFNLGHGVVQQTPVDNAIALVDAVHELSSR